MKKTTILLCVLTVGLFVASFTTTKTNIKSTDYYQNCEVYDHYLSTQYTVMYYSGKTQKDGKFKIVLRTQNDNTGSVTYEEIDVIKAIQICNINKED